MKVLTTLKRSLFAAVLLAGLASAPAAVTDFTFLNGFSGANESSANGSSGSFQINNLQFDDTVGAFGTLSLNVSFSGLSGNATAAHIHGLAPVGVSTGVLQGLTVTPATAGTISGSWAPVSAAQVTGLFGGQTYLNLHSTTIPGGEWRGQLGPVPAAVPEPSTWALFGVGALGFLYQHRRRR